MRPLTTAAALCAAFLTFPSAPRADEDVPEPVSRTVVEPPSEPAPPAEAAVVPTAATPQAPPTVGLAPRAARSELGFTLRIGGAETDRLLLGGSFGGASGPFMVGLSVDGTFDVKGSHRRGDRRDDDDWGHWCAARSGGRCYNRADLATAGYLGLRHKTAPVLGGARLRLELAGELGWQWSYVEEQVTNSRGGHTWSDAGRAYPIAGVRGQVGLVVLRHATFGIGGYARQGLSGRVCVNTDLGCVKVGGATAGVYFFGGGDWGFGG